jgi:cupin 2 domain-containing protein
MDNIFKIAENLPSQELFETILSKPNFLVERIVSSGQVTPSGQWYDQETDEWVILLQGEAELSYQDGSRLRMRSGDYVMILAHQKHRVEYTSSDPVCIWLAIHMSIDFGF